MIKIKELSEITDVTLTKVNKEVIADIGTSFLVSLTKDIVEIDTVSLAIPKYISSSDGKKKVPFITYNEIDFERCICLNDSELYVIKDITIKGIGDNKKKHVTAYSTEKKLMKNDFEVEDIGFKLIGSEEEKGIFSLNDYMYKETGWKFGHIDESVQYDILEDGTKQEKLRWQESVTSNWHDFLANTIREQFDCVVIFDGYSKEVNLYNIDSFGDEVVLSLGYDSFLRDLEKKGSTENIVTRMVLTGNEDVNILDETPTGYPYIEDYSYFMNKGDMSDGLTRALTIYGDVVKERGQTWKQLKEQVLVKQKELTKKKSELLVVAGEINGLNGLINAYNTDTDGVDNAEAKAQAIAERDKKRDEYAILDVAVTDLDEEVRLLKESMVNINILCKRETATDREGNLIFNQELLDELKEFVYCDTYSNDAFLDVRDLIKTGERQLELKSVPTSEWTVDSANFMKRVIGHRYRRPVNFSIGLGNVVELCSDEDEIDFAYFTGFTKNFESNSISLVLSNKKVSNSDLRVIGDKLYKAEKASKAISKNRYLWVQQKNNRINLDYTKGE